VSAGHHIGTIMIGQSAIAISLNLVREKDATIEFILCTVWGNCNPFPPLRPLIFPTNTPLGAFDIISESFPHLSIILYRTHPTSHQFLVKIFRLSCITTFIGTIFETILTMYLFGSLWDRWTLAFKIVTPLLHILFASCQLWGSLNFWKMMRWQEGIVERERKAGEEEKIAEVRRITEREEGELDFGCRGAETEAGSENMKRV
jgi:hypothetical protein